MKRYKINLASQIAYFDPDEGKGLYFTVSVGRDKRVMKGKRDVLIIEQVDSEADFDHKYKVNKNRSIEIPKSVIRWITHDQDDNPMFSMISAIDDKARKILVPWLDGKGNF